MAAPSETSYIESFSRLRNILEESPSPSPDRDTLDPSDWPGFRAQAHRMLDDILDYTDRKSTRLNSSHLVISYAVFCLKKKKTYVEPLHRSMSIDTSGLRSRLPLPDRRVHRHGGGIAAHHQFHALVLFVFFFFNDTATTEIYTLSLHDALPISTSPSSCLVSMRPRL